MIDFLIIFGLECVVFAIAIGLTVLIDILLGKD